jgi:hypothetical protein
MIVDVIGPVGVAALVNRNETVDVIEAVDDAHATGGLDRPMREHAPLPEARCTPIDP